MRTRTGPPLQLDRDGVNSLLIKAFPLADPNSLALAQEVGPGWVLVVRPYGGERTLRPGGVISGPTLMEIADLAAYTLVLAHIGEQLMAVTSSLTMNFLRGAKPGDIHARADMLRLGRRIAVCDVRIWTEGPDRPAAQATVTYAIPSA
ncbi:MAG: PaaI family thioesterase [Alphaproteobacteria bacterium]